MVGVSPTIVIFSNPLAILIVVPFIVYLANVFSSAPFLQHEILGQAFWWNHPGQGFLELLFDSERMDCFRGRFRYIEYLMEAAVWKMTGAGWLPRDLYDYLSIGLVVACGVLLLILSRRRGLSRVSQLLVLTFFLFSNQSFLVGVFHFRKAKVLVGLLLLLLGICSDCWGRRRVGWAVFTLGAVGFLTDPFWIILAPLVALGLDWASSRKKLPVTKWLMMGWGAGLVLSWLLANVVGPQFHRNSGITLHPPGIPINFFRFENLSLFPRIATDIFIPSIMDTTGLIGLGLIIGLLFLAQQRMFVIWVLCLVVAAFLMQPTHERAFFSGYYGFPLLAIACLGMILALSSQGRATCIVIHLLLGVSVLSHQYEKGNTFHRWKKIYTDSPEIEAKVEADRLSLAALVAHLKKSTQPYQVILDKRDNPMMRLSAGSYSDENGKWERTDIAYLLIPALFQKEIREGKVVFLERSVNASALVAVE